MKSHPGKTSQLSKQMRKRITKATFLLLASIGLLILLFWPSIVTAVPLTTQQQFDGVWQQARDIGNYQFNASALQTSHPTPRIENVGRGPEQSLLLASGLVNMSEEQMELNLQSGGRSLMVQMVDGSAYGRTDADDEWVELQDPDMIFAPGNDVMGFSSAAVNIAEVDNWQETLELDSITAVRTAKADTMYTFDISGLRFAEYMRQQAEIQMLNDGEMHPGMELGLAQHFVDMTGQGQLWVNEQGLPVYQTLHLEFPPDRGAMERVEADIITEFTGWNSSALNNQFFWTIPRLVEDPSILQTAPLTLLPNLDSFTPESWETLGLNLGLTFLLAALLLLAFANRRSPKLYPAIALAVIFSMLITPLLRVGQAHAFATNRQADYEAQASTPAEQEVMDELNGLDSEFNPTLDPLAGTQASAPAPLSQGIAELPAADQFSNPILNIPTENEALFASPVLQVTCDLNDSEADCDGDGLANGVEIFRLGTDPEDIDSDGDLISDATEVAGFNNGTQWYMNPLDADTNGDGLVDLAECFERIDVADGAFNGTDVSNIDCPDTDGDGAPDVFDYDNDGDGVPDAADSSPNFVGTIVDTAQDAIDINMTGYTTDSTLIVEYQIRPDNVDHLWQTGNSFIWPNDKQGQITFVHDREVTMIPMLEITIPSPASNSSNIVGSLPITPTKTINDIATDDTVDTWLDTATLGMYGINVTQSTDDGSLLAYVPLTVVNDPVGDMAVAWSGTMVYRPEVSNWGQDHEARVVWFISGNTSYCDVSDMPDVVTFVNRQGKTVEVKEDNRRYDVWCAQNENWVTNENSSVLHVYDEQFTVTGMNFTENNGVETAVIAQTDALATTYEDDLWRLANGLFQSFVQGKVFGANLNRFDITEVKNRFDNDSTDPYANGADELWGIDNGSFNISVNSSPDLISALDSVGKVHIPQLLGDTYNTPAADDVVNIITLREQSTRSTIIENSASVTISNGTVSVDFSDQDSSLRSSIQWGPYSYDGIEWDPADVIDYIDITLENQLDTGLLDSHITAILDPGESINNLDDARAGILSLASSYYIGVYQGTTRTVESAGQLLVDTSSSEVDDYLVNDVTINLGANPTFVSVSNETLLLFQDFIEEELFVEVDGNVVGSPITGGLTKIDILETFGSAKNGTAEEGTDIGASLIQGSKGGLKKVASLFEKKVLKLDEIDSKASWQARGKNVATALNLVVGAVGFIGPELGLSEAAVVGIQVSLGFASEALSAADAVREVKGGLNSLKVGYWDDFYAVKKATKSGAVIGLIIDTAIIVGVAVYTILSQDIEPGSIAFNTIIATAIGQFIVAIITAVIGAIFPVGTVIVAIISLIDFLIAGICAIIEAVEGDGTISDDVDKWVCGGISGAIAAGITELIYDNYLTVDLNKEGRMTPSLSRPEITAPNGYIPGTSVQISMEVVTKLSLASIEDGLISRSFTTSQLRGKMRRSAFGYYLQTSRRDHHDELSFGSVSWPNDQQTFNPSITLNFNSSGINQSRDIYFTESYNVVTVECWGFIFTSNLSCDEEPTRDSSHTKVDTFVFDIFPATFDDLLKRNGGSSKNYQWNRSAYADDIDGDGLITFQTDRFPTTPDFDGDGLSDRWELENGTDPTYADRDNDGLIDYWEVVYETDPYLKDTDGDGLLDGEEFPRTQLIDPFGADTLPWTGGWLITYDYDANDSPLDTWVWADAFSADSDDDGMTDPTERFYNYNPNVANVLNPVSLVSDFSTNSVQAGVVGIQETINYTATVGNEDQFNTISGQFNVEIPEDFPQVTETISTLLPEETVDFSGTATVADITASQYTSVTMRAQVTLAGVMDTVSGNALLHFPLDENTATGVVENRGSLGGQATCDTSIPIDKNGGGCPLFGDIGQVLEAANFNVRYPKEITYPFVSGLEQNDFSMSGWFKFLGGASDPKFLFGREEYSLALSGTRVLFSISSNDGANCGAPTQLTSDTKLRRGQWDHVVATYDDTTGLMQIFINGVLDANTATHTGGVCTVEDNPLIVGNPATGSTRFRGLMDEVQLYGSTLNQTEIDNLYNYQFYFFDAVQRFPVIVDAEGPVNTLNLDTDLPNAPVMLSITSEDDFSIVKEVQVTVTSPSSNVEVLNAVQDESESGLWFFMFTPDIEGQYTIDIDALDAVNNVGSEQVFIYVDDTPSVTTIDSSLTSSPITTNQDSIAEDNRLLLFGDITDNRTLGDNVTIDVLDWLSATVQTAQITEIVTTTNSIGTWEADYFFPARAYGEYDVTASSEDFVGNSITETIGTLQIDDFGPWSDVTISRTDIVSGSDTIIGTVNDIRYDLSGRIFHMHLDETAGSTEFIDSTQRKFVAICSGSGCPTAGVNGVYDSALSFDGSDDRLEIAADDVFTMTNTTLMAWVNPTWASGSNGYDPTILAVDDGTDTNFRWQIADDYSAMILVTDSETASVPININPNEWTHLALVLEGGAWSAYVNGVSTVTISQTLGLQADLPFNIGAANASEGHFTGLLDEVVVYSHGVLLDEIYDIANPLATTVVELEMQARHLNGAIWPEVDPDGLKMYIPFDDPNGVTDFNQTSLIDSPVTCDDEVGGCPVAGVSGALPSSTAVLFDGDDYIAIPDTEALDLEQIAVSFWVKAPATSRNDLLIAKGRLGWAIRFALPDGDGRILFETPGLQAPNNVFAVVGGPNVLDDQWHHVVVMYDGESKIIYVDGVKHVEQAVTGSLPQTDQPLTLGSVFANGGFVTGASALNGALDEVAIFNRALTDDEIQTLYTWDTWQTVTLDSPNSFYSTWSAAVPEGLEGLYTIGLRATDSVGNQLTNPEAWTGPIDLRAPRLSFDYISLPDDNVQSTCAADDLNITETGWVCPAGNPISETRQSSDWFVDYFTAMTRTVGLQSDTVTINTTSDGTFTACDLHNNCRSETTPKQAAAEGVAILSPVNGTRLTNFDPITISGFAWSDQEIRQVNLLVNGQTVKVFSWTYSQGATQSSWSTTWTPTPGVTEFDLEAILLTAEYQGNGFDPNNVGVFIDEAQTILKAPTLVVDKTVAPDIAAPGETVTFTIEVANNGLNSLNNVSIVDTLPAGVTPITAVTGISDTVSIPVGTSVIYEIPVTVDAGQVDDVVNTVFVDHVSFDSEDSATLRICDETFVVTNTDQSGVGTLQDALDNICDGGTITFGSDLFFGGGFGGSFINIDKPVTIDGTGFDIVFNFTESLSSFLTVEDGVGPVTVRNISIVKYAEFVEGDEIFIIDNGVSSNLTLIDVAMDIENFDEYLITNLGEMTVINSQVWGSVGTNNVINNAGTLAIQNSTIDASVDNAANAVITIDYSTLFAGVRVDGVDEDVPASSGIFNEGTVKLNSNILVTANSDCSGAGSFQDLGYNLVSNAGSCPTGSGTTSTIVPSLLFTDVLTGLADNGGSTMTYALLSNSPALDVIPRSTNDCGAGISSDQRGIGRPQNAICEIGAYEVSNNINPVAVDDTAVTDEEITVTIDVLANDSDGDFDTLTITSVTQPTNGTAAIVNNGTDTQFIEYTSSATFDGGVDTFTYAISDGAGGTDTATVNVTVNTVNDIPNAVDDLVNTVQNTAIVIDVLANDIDEDTLSIEEVTQPVSGTAVINGNQIVYTPPTDFLGVETFEYVATDGSALSNFALVQVTVNPLGTNNPPTVSAGDDMVVTLPNSITLNGVASDDGLPNPPGALTLLWTQVSGPGSTNFGDASSASTTASFTAAGVYVLELTADDSEFTASDQVMITVNANVAPDAVDDSATTDEDVALTIDVLANDSDADGDSLTIDSVTDPANGSVLNNGTDVTYTPDADFNGTDSFDYTISDGNGGTDTATVTVTINAVNDEPVANEDSDTTAEDTAVTIDVLANDTDVDGDTLTVDSVTDPANGTVVNNGSDVTYTPDAGFNGTDSFDYTISDGNGGTDTATVTLTVSSENDLPAAVDDNATTDEDTAVTIDVLANDSDPDGDTLTIDSVTDPANGTVVNNGTDVTYTPAPDFNGIDSFDYTISDGNGGTATATVTVTVTAVNDAPVAADDSATTDEDTAVTIDVIANDSDVDGDTLTVDSVTDPANGTVVNNGSDVTYTPDPGFFGTDSFDYTVIDGNGGTDTASVTVTVNEVVGLQADLSVTKTDDADPLDVEQMLTYTIVVSNNGPDLATGVTVTDTLPAEVGFESVTTSQGSCVEEDDEVVCDLGELSSSATATITIQVMPEEAGEITNLVEVLGNEADPDLTNNAASETTTVTDAPFCNGVAATIIGTDGDDVLNGTSGDDVIVGLSGNDIIDGKGGNDIICGGSGDDDISGGNGQDLLKGGNGADTLTGNRGDDVLRGGRGADVLEGGNGADELRGGRGDDLLEGNSGQDILYGRRGDDLLLGGSGADELYGGRGNDNLQGGSGADLLDGGKGDDLLLGQSGKDTLLGEKGNDDLRGGSGGDDLFGGNGDDALTGNGGNDFCDGGNGADTGTSCETEVDIP